MHLRDAWGYTALHWAASRGHEAVTALLLSKKVRFDLPSTAVPICSRSACNFEPEVESSCNGQEVANVSHLLRRF